MAIYHRNSERKRIPHDFRRQEEEVVGSLCRLASRPVSPKSLLEQEKRIRREIANSNERRRMQSINAGFQSLRALLPHREGEKLSKAAILQSTADYVYQLEQEKTRLLEQNRDLLRKILNSQNIDSDCSDSPLPKRTKRESADLVDEGIGSLSPSQSENEDTKREVISLKLQLEHERTLRMLLKDRVRDMETRLYPLESDLTYNSGPEDNMKSSVHMGHESGLGSPQSPISNPDLESNHEMSVRDSSPELSSVEIPEDLSGKTTNLLFPSTELATTTLLMPVSPPLSAASSPFPSDIIQQPVYKVSRQNLETIVEAIRHVEGDHMFRDMEEEEDEEHYTEQPTTFSSFQHQIIRNAPLTQSRPGVIVSNLS